MESIARRRVQNRILAVITHLPRYGFCPQARLAEDAHVSPSTISRFLAGECNPSFALVAAIALALERQMGHRIDTRELVSLDGTYPTPSVCDLCGCRGCFPPNAFDAEGNLRSEYHHLRPGDWCRFPPPPPGPATVTPTLFVTSRHETL